jgi:FkbM family methyltransferase
MHACTIVARNYLAFARVLAESFLEIHPESSFTTLVVDAECGFDATDEPFNVVTPAELDLNRDEFHRMAVMYDVTELSTALKPWMLRYLIENGADAVLYIDPDIQLFNPIDDVAKMVAEHGVALTPHTLVPMPRDSRRPSEADIMGSGVYNLGFIGVGPLAIPFLRWWEERLMRDAISAPEQMLFTDQRWIDFVPSYFGHHIIRDPGFNVAYWNLDAREVTKEGDRYLVNGFPLRFFHFSGYRPETPWILSKYVAGSPRILLSEHPVLRELCDGYAASLGTAAFEAAAATPYGFNTLPNGTPVTNRMRRIYREAVLAHERGLGAPPPVAFGPDSDDGDALISWLNDPVEGPTHAPLTRMMAHIWSSRSDLQWVFRDPAGAGWPGFSRWMRERAAIEEHVPPALIPSAMDAGDAEDGAPAPSPGVNIVGYVRAELGVGQTSRYMIDAAKLAGLDYSVHAHTKTLSRQEHPFDESESSDFAHEVNVLVINGDQTADFLRDAPFDIRRDRHTVGVWAWEVDELPSVLWEAFSNVDEIWAVSSFVQRALAKHSPVPVEVFPKPIMTPDLDPTITRESLGLPSGFVFLFAFDHLSVLARKNPIGVIEAFSQAFRPGEGPTLVIKSINGDRCLTDRERVRFAAAGRPDVLLIEDYLSAAQTRALTALSDCYVSLHRSEGYGLTMSEAMSLGRPVIATGYSGNLDFMDEDTALLVPYEEVRVGAGAEPYSPSAVWAEPDLGAAAAYMRKVHDDPAFASDLGQRGRDSVLARHSLEITASFLVERVAAAHLKLAERSLPEVQPVEEPEQDLPPTPHELYREAVDRASRQLDSVPDPHAPTRIRFLVPLFRRVVNRVLAHHDAHQRQSLSLLLEAVEALSHDDQVSHLDLSQRVADQRVRGEELQSHVDQQLWAASNSVRDVTVRHRAFDEQLRRLVGQLSTQGHRADQIEVALGEVARDAAASLSSTAGTLAAFNRQAMADLSGEIGQLRRTEASLQDALDLLASRWLVGADGPDSAVVSTDVGVLLLPKNDPVVLPWMRVYGNWEPEESAFLRSAIKPGDTFLDVGAHVGYHTLAGARAVGPTGQVIAVEPSPEILALLRNNLRNNLTGDSADIVHVAPVAAWDSDTTLTFTQSVEGNSGDSRVYADDHAATGITVDARRLDSLEALGGTTVAVVKTDLQGRDHRALRGLRKIIERDRPVIVTEFWPEGIRDLGDDPAIVLGEYADMGYRLSTLPGQPDLPHDLSETVALADSVEGGFLTLCLTPVQDHPAQP